MGGVLREFTERSMEQSKKPVFLIKKYKDILWAISAIEAATFFVSCADTLIAGNAG